MSGSNRKMHDREPGIGETGRRVGPLRRLGDRVLPPNSKRRLMLGILRRLLARPRDAARHVNLAAVRSFLHYLRTLDPSRIEELVAATLAPQPAIGVPDGEPNACLVRMATAGGGPAATPARGEPVDIVMPVRDAGEQTSASIASILAHSDNCRLILVNDAGSDAPVAPLLDRVRGVAQRNVEVVVRHGERPRGFAATLSAALASTRHHFVVLGAAVEVPPGWLDRLFAPILAAPDRVATVIPFGNARGAGGFPEPYRDNELFKGLTVAELDAHCRSHAAEPVEIACATGVCVAFNRTAVERVGLPAGEDRGAERDAACAWSLRAAEAGFRHVLAPNLFVGCADVGARAEEGQTRPPGREPGRADLPPDQPRAIREALTVMIDARTKGAVRRVAILDVDMTGGGTIYSAALAEHLRDAGMDLVHCKYNFRQECLKVRVESACQARSLVLPRAATEALPALWSFLGVDFVIVNELFSWPDPAGTMERLATGAVPYLSLVHDFFMICPSWFLMNKKGKFCDLPADPAECAACLRGNLFSGHRDVYGSRLDDLAAWRAGVRTFLARAQRVVCFSGSTAGLLARIYPELSNVAVQEHAVPNRERLVWRQRRFDGTGTLNLGIIGNLLHVKGEKVVRQLVDSSRFRALPVRLKVFGASPVYPAGFTTPDGKMTVLGGYRQEELPELLEREGIAAVLIPSVWPETFSYTTSEAILLGYPVICFNIGAQAARVTRYRCGIVIDDISANGLLTAIEEILRHPALVEGLSRNARDYLPPPAGEHFGALVRIISAHAPKEA
jgi:glycosyl transferase family 1/glycosyl transferase family 2